MDLPLKLSETPLKEDNQLLLGGILPLSPKSEPLSPKLETLIPKFEPLDSEDRPLKEVDEPLNLEIQGPEGGNSAKRGQKQEISKEPGPFRLPFDRPKESNWRKNQTGVRAAIRATR